MSRTTASRAKTPASWSSASGSTASRTSRTSSIPIKSLVRSAATLGDEQPDFFISNRSIKYFYSVLPHSEKMVSVYAGLNDGAFRQARRIDPTVRIDGKLPPQGTQFAYRWIDAKEGEGSLDHYVFLDANGQGLGASQQVTAYDPRTRAWYRNTVAAGTTYITDPDVFAALGLIGFTVAAPFSADGEMPGVVAIDITLDGLSAYLAERKISPGTVSYMLDQQGRVLAASDLSKTYTNNNGRVELTPHLLARQRAAGHRLRRPATRRRRATGFTPSPTPARNTSPACRRCRPTSASAGSSSSSRRSPTSPAPSERNNKRLLLLRPRRDACCRSSSSISWPA